MARYALGLLFLAAGLQLLVALPTDKPSPDGANAPAPTTSEPVTSEVTKEPKTTEATTTTTEANTAETTTEEQEETAPPVICLDPREIYNECGSACDDRTCDNQRRSDVLCSKQCVEGCYCRNGYVRDKTGKCIPSYRCGKGWW